MDFDSLIFLSEELISTVILDGKFSIYCDIQIGKWVIVISLAGWTPIHRFFNCLINIFRGNKDRGFEFYCTTGVGQ